MARIENVIFDMGGVLMDWDPDAVARHFCDTDEDARILADTIFRSHEWAWLDADAIDLDYAYEAVSARLPERLREAGRNLASGDGRAGGRAQGGGLRHLHALERRPHLR